MLGLFDSDLVIKNERDTTMASDATIRSRVEKFTAPGLVGQTVSEIRANFGKILNISANATPMVDNEAVGEDYVLRAGDVVNFSVALGEKGR
jgi:molybdopterin converting factor small subunit